MHFATHFHQTQVLQQPFSGATTTSLTPPTLTLNATAGSKRAGSTTQQQDLAHSNHTRADHGGMAQNELRQLWRAAAFGSAPWTLTSYAAGV